MAKGRVLHILSQRPLLTGSGVTLDAIVRHAARAGWEQRVVVGVPHGERPTVGELPAEHIHPLHFGADKLDFPVPGMSDVMPYESSVFSKLEPRQIENYLGAWREHLDDVLHEFRPDVIHAHHAWLLASMLKDLAPSVPVLVHGHGTDLRQLELCKHLAEEVRLGVRRNERFAVLHSEHAEAYGTRLELEQQRLHVIGAGYREEIFHSGGRNHESGPTILYAGKYSHAKGLPWLLDAVERLSVLLPEVTLHVAGTGSGQEAELLRARMQGMNCVKLHGQVDQKQLAELMRNTSVFVLPSFYEGLPLVLVEAVACGCRLVATDTPGVVHDLAPQLGEAIELVRLPRLEGPDTPVQADLPEFTNDLEAALHRALHKGPLPDDLELKPFTWNAVFQRVEHIWLELKTRAAPLQRSLGEVGTPGDQA
ncbi:MAG: D-inositol-3-phosphate glycosyltransferase [Planctomycetes bacterium]|nr:D-inositol-3-phosphate glycosyltransferase [Planctomycetota bacterium]